MLVQSKYDCFVMVGMESSTTGLYSLESNCTYLAIVVSFVDFVAWKGNRNSFLARCDE